MSVHEINENLAKLPRKEQDEIVAFLFHLRHPDDSTDQTSISQRLSDKDPSQWLSPEQFEHELNKRQRQ
jgi:hypothetical protein